MSLDVRTDKKEINAFIGLRVTKGNEAQHSYIGIYQVFTIGVGALM